MQAARSAYGAVTQRPVRIDVQCVILVRRSLEN